VSDTAEKVLKVTGTKVNVTETFAGGGIPIDGLAVEDHVVVLVSACCLSFCDLSFFCQSSTIWKVSSPTPKFYCCSSSWTLNSACSILATLHERLGQAHDVEHHTQAFGGGVWADMGVFRKSRVGAVASRSTWGPCTYLVWGPFLSLSPPLRNEKFSRVY